MGIEYEVRERKKMLDRRSARITKLRKALKMAASTIEGYNSFSVEAKHIRNLLEDDENEWRNQS